MKSIEDFLGMYSKISTVRAYRSGIYSFFDHYHGCKVRQNTMATKEDKKKYEELNQQYFSEDRKHITDLISFLVSMDGSPPSTIKLKLNAVKELLRFNDIELSQSEVRTLKHKTPKAKLGWTDEQDVTKENLQKVLSHTDEKGTALILMLASSGMRIGEALQIKLSDISLTDDLPVINIRGEYTKTDERRYVCISREAKQFINEWLLVRDDYLKSSQHRNRGLVEKANAKQKQLNDDRLFPFSGMTAREMWANALKKSGLYEKDESTNRLTYRIHGLRKFFRSQLALGCKTEITEALMGHEQYLTWVYRKYQKKQLKNYYLKGEKYVTIFGSGDLEEIQETLRDTQMAMSGYKSSLEEKDKMISFLIEEVEGMREKLSDVDKIGKAVNWFIENMIEDERKEEVRGLLIR